MRNAIIAAFAWYLVIQYSQGLMLFQDGGRNVSYQSLEHCQRAGQIAYDNRQSSEVYFNWFCIPTEEELGE